MEMVQILVPHFLRSLLILTIIGVGGCTRNQSLNINQTITRYDLKLYDGYAEGEDISRIFKLEPRLYINKETDSCLLILIDKSRDTVLAHLDSGIGNIRFLSCFKKNDDLILVKRDYGKTIFADSLDQVITKNTYVSAFPLDKFYKITDRFLEQIPLISKKRLYKQIASKFNFLQKVKMAGADNTSIYVFKDTLGQKQVLYQLAATYGVAEDSSRYVLKANVKSANKLGIYKDNITVEKLTFRGIGKPIKSENSCCDFQYEPYINNYFEFKSRSKQYNNAPRHDLVKIEIGLYDKVLNKNSIIETFNNNEFENINLELIKDRHKYYIGKGHNGYLEGYYFELDTVKWKLVPIH